MRRNTNGTTGFVPKQSIAKETVFMAAPPATKMALKVNAITRKPLHKKHGSVTIIPL